MVIRWMVMLHMIFVKPTRLIYETCQREGSKCYVKDGHIRFQMVYDGHEFAGDNIIDYQKIFSGEKTLLDYANVAYDQMHQAIDRYNEKKHSFIF